MECKHNRSDMEAEQKTLQTEMDLEQSGNGKNVKNVNFLLSVL